MKYSVISLFFLNLLNTVMNPSRLSDVPVLIVKHQKLIKM